MIALFGRNKTKNANQFNGERYIPILSEAFSEKMAGMLKHLDQPPPSDRGNDKEASDTTR